MRSRRETFDVLNDLIVGWVITFIPTVVTDNADGTYLITTCKTYYLQAGTNITIGTNTYLILDVEIDQSILIKGLVLPQSAPFTLPPPYFFHGKIVDVNTELSKVESASLKTPMIYLARPYTENIDPDDKVATIIERTADVTLYFLTQANFDLWLTHDHDHNAIIPMKNMMYEFIELLKNSEGIIGRLVIYPAIEMIRFGVVVSNKSTPKALFDDKLSGVQCNLSLPILYSCDC